MYSRSHHSELMPIYLIEGRQTAGWQGSLGKLAVRRAAGLFLPS